MLTRDLPVRLHGDMSIRSYGDKIAWLLLLGNNECIGISSKKNGGTITYDYMVA